jgi:hypothetical protein
VWFLDLIKRHNSSKGSESSKVNNENRPIKIIKTGFNSWQIVYADVKEN